MIHHRNAAGLAVWLCLSLCAGAAVKKSDIRITVVDSQTRSVTIDNSGVEKNCDGVNYDAYCHNSKTAEITNLLQVREGDGPPFWVSCNVDTKWSRWMPLAKGESFDARRERRGLSIYFADDNGKMRQQLYKFISPDGTSEAVVATPPGSAPVPEAARSADPRQSAGDAVKCSFASTPVGAEITVDGKYVGSTPSTLNLSLGTHAVEVSLPGFVEWKRQLMVSPGSELTVNAALQKAQ